jgi:hypothetical protein
MDATAKRRRGRRGGENAGLELAGQAQHPEEGAGELGALEVVKEEVFGNGRLAVEGAGLVIPSLGGDFAFGRDGEGFCKMPTWWRFSSENKAGEFD